MHVPYCAVYSQVDMQFTEMYKKLWKTNFKKVFPVSSVGKSELQELVSLLHSAMWNLSDKSSDVCQRIMQVR